MEETKTNNWMDSIKFPKENTDATTQRNVPRKERRAIERQLKKLPPGEREGWLKKNGYSIR